MVYKMVDYLVVVMVLMMAVKMADLWDQLMVVMLVVVTEC